MTETTLTWKCKDNYGARAHLFEESREGYYETSICGMMRLPNDHPALNTVVDVPTCAKCRDLQSLPVYCRSLKGSAESEVERLKKTLRDVYLMIPNRGILWMQKARKRIRKELKDD